MHAGGLAGGQGAIAATTTIAVIALRKFVIADPLILPAWAV